jgi:hypothetical protein
MMILLQQVTEGQSIKDSKLLRRLVNDHCHDVKFRVGYRNAGVRIWPPRVDSEQRE